MKAKYRNIFTKQGTPLENDVTKILINVLQNSHLLTNLFFKEFVKIDTKSDRFWYDLQIGNTKINELSKINNRFHLLITSKWNEKNIEEPKVRDSSIPDAAIYDDTYLVIIESKVSASKDIEQIKKQSDLYKLTGNFETTWQDISDFIRSKQATLKKNNKNDIANYLVSQFLEYLEVINMGGFGGITFIEKNEKGKNKVSYDIDKAKNNLKSLMQKLYDEQLKQNGYEWKKRTYDQYVWDSFYYKNLPEMVREKIHFSVYMFKDFSGMDYLISTDIFKKLFKENSETLVSLFFNFCEQITKVEDKKNLQYDWFLEFSSYKIKDHKKGQMKGDRYNPFEIKVNCLHVNKDDIKQIFNLLNHSKGLVAWKEIKLIKKINYFDTSYKFDQPDEIFNNFREAFTRLNDFNNQIFDLLKKKILILK